MSDNGMPEETVVPRLSNWADIRTAFNWNVSEHFNIARACCEKWAEQDPDRIALLYLNRDDVIEKASFGDLSDASSRLANVWNSAGIEREDRCAIFLPQRPETLICHLACYKMAAVALPLFTLFGADALEYRLINSGARVVVTDRENLQKILSIHDRLPDLEQVYCVDGPAENALDFHVEIDAASPDFEMVETLQDDPALLVYTSGTTGPPKGALHGHRVLLGHLPGVETHHDFFPKQGDLMWTPADWAWIGGLMNALMPSLFYGVPVVAHRMAKFSPEAAYDLIRRLGVRNSFLPPTALKLMRQAETPGELPLRSVGSGGEALGADLLDWGRTHLGVTINEFYGQTECNLVLGNCSAVEPPVPGSMGRAVPGCNMAVLNEKGVRLRAGEIGEIAVQKGHKAMFLEYWGQPDKTAQKFAGDWMRTGDVGYQDENGYFFYSSRDDDVITSAGYRIGPTEIEACLTAHDAVVMAAVVGVPDPVKGEAVKAFVVLRDGAEWSGLERDLIMFVRERISPHVAPREVEPIAEMPMTTTGKIIRRDLRDRNSG